MMYLIYYKENSQRIWIIAEEKKLVNALHEIWSNPNVTEVYYVPISHRWEEYNGIKDMVKIW